jgi:hypothetical protein
VVVQECFPTLCGRSFGANQVFADTGFADFKYRVSATRCVS